MASLEKSVIDVCKKVISDWIPNNTEFYVDELPLTQEEKKSKDDKG